MEREIRVLTHDCPQTGHLLATSVRNPAGTYIVPRWNECGIRAGTGYVITTLVEEQQGEPFPVLKPVSATEFKPTSEEWEYVCDLDLEQELGTQPAAVSTILTAAISTRPSEPFPLF